MLTFSWGISKQPSDCLTLQCAFDNFFGAQWLFFNHYRFGMGTGKQDGYHTWRWLNCFSSALSICLFVFFCWYNCRYSYILQAIRWLLWVWISLADIVALPLDIYPYFDVFTILKTDFEMTMSNAEKVMQVYCTSWWLWLCPLVWFCCMLSRGLKLGHYNDVIMGAMASQITSLTIVYTTVYSRRRSKKTSKPRVTGLCAWNSPVTGEFPAQMASNAENVSIWWRHHVQSRYCNGFL